MLEGIMYAEISGLTEDKWIPRSQNQSYLRKAPNTGADMNGDRSDGLFRC